MEKGSLARLARLCCASGLAAVLAGCGKMGFYQGYAAKPIDVSERRTVYDKIETAVRARTKASADCFPDQYQPGQASVDCKGVRNQVIAYLMAESVELCRDHVSEIYGTEAGFNIATGSIAALTSGFAAISPGSRAQSLAAISSFTSAERALVNESVYKNLLTTAIATKIEQQRGTLGKALLAKKSESYANYRIDDAIYDVIDYHHACSFYKGMELALAEGTNTNPATKLAALEVQSQALAQQIDIRAQALRMDEASRRSLLDPKAAIGEPILKALVDRYQAIQQQILTGIAPAAPATARRPAEDAVPAGAVTPEEGATNPLAGLAAAEDRLRKSSADVAAATKALADAEKKVLPDGYLRAVEEAVGALASQFNRELLGAGKAGDPDPAKGAIAKAIKTFHDAQTSYLLQRSRLDLTQVDGRAKERELAYAVRSTLLEVQHMQDRVALCEAVARERVATFRSQELAVLKAKSSEELAKVGKADLPLAAKPAWTGADATNCMK